MFVTLLALSDALAFDCVGRDPVSCEATLQLADQINAVFGPGTIDDGQASARLRPLHIYQRMEGIRQTAAASECLNAAITLRGTYGGQYDLSSNTFEGPWAELGGADFGEVDSGVIFRAERSFAGSFVSDVTGLPGDLGEVFASYSTNGQVAGDRDGGFFMGMWVRVAGTRGYYATVYGDCVGDPRFAFDGWYSGDLTSGIATVGLDTSALGVEISLPTPLDPLATLDAPALITGTLRFTTTGPGRVTAPATPGASIAGNGTASVVIDLVDADRGDVEGLIRGTTLRSTSLGSGSVEVVLDTAAFPGVPTSRAYVVGPLDLTVGPTGDYLTIREALDKVRFTTGAAGSTIRVAAGDYTGEGILSIALDPDHEGLTVLGASAGVPAGVNAAPAPGSTRIQAMTVSANGVTLDGLDALGAPSWDGFDVRGSGVTLRNCTATGGPTNSAVSIRAGRVGVTIEECAFTGYPFGVFLQSANGHLIRGNTFEGHASAGVSFNQTEPSSVQILGNAFVGNGDHIETRSNTTGVIDASGNAFEGTGLVFATGSVALDASGSWWGQATGPLASQIATAGTATLDTSGHLTVDPFPAFP